MACRILSAVVLFVTTLTALAQEPTIAPTSRYPANLSSVQVADLNGNNAPEIIGLDNTSASVVVLKNLGNGKYGAPTYYAISGQPNGIAVGDFNGDGKLDVAVAIGAYNATQGRVA
ncbi:MAG: large repetitive protein, partial [Rhodospirillaceae bacterium]|nr:large repetitive protein [Rhodospirillaceae bacterium]